MFSKMRNVVALVTGLMVLMVAGEASAALPAAATTALTSLQTDGLALIDAAWPVIAAIVVGFIIIKLFKKAANKV
jgi:hypothetical protein